MRVLAPRVHVEIFRPTHKIEFTTPKKLDPVPKSLRVNPGHLPNELTYIRVAPIEDRRIKGLQFEETALFGGFIEINIAEDPQSELFDKFLPNDHIEVFFNDSVKRAGKDEEVYMHNLNIQNDYDYTNETPKFQGATWKTDLKYRPTMVTTQIHAWDYLRILQYINIPKGERKEKSKSIRVIVDSKPEEETRLKITQQRQKYGDDMLDYIDGAVNAFIDKAGTPSIYGQHVVPTENVGLTRTSGLKFSTSSLKIKQDSNLKDNLSMPIIRFYKAGIGFYLHNKLNHTYPFKSFKDVYGNTGKPEKDIYGKIVVSKKKIWNAPVYDPDKPEAYNVGAAIEDVSDAIDTMEKLDIMQFRIIDGKFNRFRGYGKDTDPASSTFGENIISHPEMGHFVVDIIAISQFALIELLVKKLTIDHGLNQWFTPIIRFDPSFIQDVQRLGKKIGKGISKLVYVRFRSVDKKGSETTTFAFNIDTYPFVAKYTTEAFKLAMGNLINNMGDGSSGAQVDMFAEILSSLDFPQRAPPSDGEDKDRYSIYSLAHTVLADGAQANSKMENVKALIDDLKERFQFNFTVSTAFDENSLPAFYETLMKRVTSFAALIQKSLTKDDKMISFIRGVPASFMRADIYTGSKFNTIQYDSLAITRMIQLIASSMAGFPSTNNPKSNTEKGSIDSYPIFAANRIVIRPKVFFGIRDKNEETSDNNLERYYKLYASLAELFQKEKYENQGNATCFLFLEVAKKKLKDKGEDPDFVFPMEDIQDFGIIKASTVNHNFTFSISDNWKDFSLFKDRSHIEKVQQFQNLIENGIFIDYRESGLSSVGFSPPEHQHLKLEDLTQDSKYTSWAPRFMPSVNIESSDSSKPIFNPSTAYKNKQAGKNDATPIPGNLAKDTTGYLINDYNNYHLIVHPATDIRLLAEPIPVVLRKGILYYMILTGMNAGKADVQRGSIEADHNITIRPFQGVTGYVDISDLKAEYAALVTILTDPETTYRDISNVDQDLMENIKIRTPLKFTYNRQADKYEDKIKFTGSTRGGRTKVHDEDTMKNIIMEIHTELEKINEIDMMWLFPYSGFEISVDTGEVVPRELDKGLEPSSETWQKHMLLITYLDLLIKGVRYILWSMAKARFFSHVYIPMEYKKYAQHSPEDLNYSSDVLEPGSSVQIRFNSEDNSLFKTIENPLIAFPIKGLEKGKSGYQPLYRSISRGTKMVSGEEQPVTDKREMTWYVSKKVTYIGADTGAMVRVEMTEGSLDWTLFYNEKNLLTQVSEHYLLNGLGNFRTGVF